MGDEAADDVLDANALGFGAVIEKDAMAEDRDGQRFDVVAGDMGAAFEQGAGFAADDEGLAGARAGAPVHPVVHEVRRTRLARARGGGEADGGGDDFLADGDLADKRMECEHVGAGKNRIESRRPAGGCALDDFHLLGLGEVIDDDVEEETVELGFRKRVRALHFDGVLRGEDEEWLGQGVAGAARGDLVFLHGFEQGGLGFGRRAVDFVGEDDVGEDRAGDKGEAPAGIGILEDFGAGDIGGHEVRCELDALEIEREDLRDRFDQQRLREAGSAGDEAMAAGKQRQQEVFDDLFLADDDFGEFGG